MNELTTFQTVFPHDYYNTDNFPQYIMTSGNWSIWANGSGHCASIPTPRAARYGCRATHFGDMAYTINQKRIPVAHLAR